jgi:hypothetical protein
MVSNRFWHIVSVVKERLASLSSRVASSEPNQISTSIKSVNTISHAFHVFHKFPQTRHKPLQWRIFRGEISVVATWWQELKVESGESARKLRKLKQQLAQIPVRLERLRRAGVARLSRTDADSRFLRERRGWAIRRRR